MGELNAKLVNLSPNKATVRVLYTHDGDVVRWVLSSSPYISIWSLIPNHSEFEIPVSISYDLPVE